MNNEEDIITKIVVISSDSVLPIDAAMKVYESENAITIKETCFGTMVTGPRIAVDRVIAELRGMDRNHIFVKERGFHPGDERRCRAVRGGGPRPGFHYLREEVQMLPMIGKALDAYEQHVPPTEIHRAEKIDTKKLKSIIESNL
ncbi:putative methanogenesis marker protein 6 [Methanomethylovorans hollandica DSM 15978]|uniref:Putative methanogenesis marker protein 6 n=1 Tax=Methanomethylovorans hollandica (strain DSM 15978 / NBRC 107637 / DMS1) TaxID=867904 RepID=L0KWV5_METHD|nr:methanogenesis marker 6 protein [Methanomethylovorans hollandica]AGB48449.1 putative methanogenesis marker protein 6 [Methanomethylovorans hollandica DSM 15978]